MSFKNIELIEDEKIEIQTHSQWFGYFVTVLIPLFLLVLIYLFLYIWTIKYNIQNLFLNCYLLVKTPVPLIYLLIMIISCISNKQRYTATNKRIIIDRNSLLIKAQYSLTYDQVATAKKTVLSSLQISFKNKQYLNYNSMYFIKDVDTFKSVILKHLELRRNGEISKDELETFKARRPMTKKERRIIIIAFLILYTCFFTFIKCKTELDAKIISRSSISSAQWAVFWNPKDDVAYYHLANAYRKTEKYNLAIVNYKKAIQINPKDDSYYAYLGYSYLNVKSYDLAIHSLQKAAKINPHNAGYDYTYIADAYKEKGDINKAINFYNKAIKLAPKIPLISLKLADIYYREKNFVEAEKLYKNVLSFSEKDLKCFEINQTEIKAKLNNIQKVKQNI